MGNPLDIGHAAGFPGTAGPPSSILENFKAIADLTYQVDSALSIEAEVQKRWQESISRYQAKVGLPLDADTDLNVINALTTPLIDAEHNRGLAGVLSGFDFTVYGPDESFQGRVDKAQAANEKIKELADPEVLSLEQILDEIKLDRLKIIERADQVEQTSGLGGLLGRLAGGIYGSISFRDPQNIPALFLGGAGKTIAQRIISEGAIGAAIEFTTQQESIQPTRELLGEPRGDVFSQVLAAGLATGLFRGGVEGIGAAARRIRGLEPSTPLTPNERLDLLETQIKAMRDGPSKRAAQSFVDDARVYNQYNPYGNSPQALRRFDDDLADIYNVLSGKTDTAIARFLPEQDYHFEVLDLDTSVAKAERPLLFEAVDQAQDRLTALDRQIGDIEERINNVPVSEVMQRIDPETAKQIARLERYIEEGDFTNNRQGREIAKVAAEIIDLVEQRTGVTDLRQRLQGLRNRFFEPIDETSARRINQEIEELNARLQSPPFIRASKRIENELREELAQLKKQRRPVLRAYNALRDELDTEISNVAAKRRLREARGAGQSSPDPTGTLFDPARNRPDVDETFERQVTEGAERIDETSEAVVNGMLLDEEKVDLGNGELVEPGREFTDPITEKPITAKAMAEEMVEDERLLKAMTECAT